MTKPRRSSLDRTKTLANLSAGRAGALSVCMSCRINSGEYRAALNMIEALDELVDCLTGDRNYLHAEAHGTRFGSKSETDPDGAVTQE